MSFDMSFDCENCHENSTCWDPRWYVLKYIYREARHRKFLRVCVLCTLTTEDLDVFN